MKKLFTLCACLASFFSLQAQNFNDYFEDKTLRTDYIFTGDAQKQEVYLDELSCLPHWAGRRHHLNELPLAGNGEITMKDKASGEVIYRTSFSSLFQAQAICTGRSKSGTLLVPRNIRCSKR